MYTKIKEISARVIKSVTTNKKKSGKIILIIGLILASLFLNVAQGKNSELIVEDSSGVEESAEYESQTDTSSSAGGYADISGEVNNPGVYELTTSTRLYELIDKAGGVTEDADIDRINQAELVEDGSKIIIPARGMAENADEDYGQGKSERTSDNELVNINTADLSELMTLNGVGEVIAGRIIEYRNGNTFNSIEDIKNVKGIGDATYDKIKDSICT